MATVMNSKFHDVEIMRTDRHALYLQVDGKHFQIPWGACSADLAEVSAVERDIIEVAPSGYGLHWPLLDEDLAIGPLLAHAHEMEATLISTR